MYTLKEARPRLVIQEAPPKGKKMAVRDYSPDGQIKMFTADVLGYVVRSSDTFSSAYNVLSRLSSQEITTVKEDVRLRLFLSRLGGFRADANRQWLVESNGT